MKKVLTNVFVLLFVFAATVALSGLLINREKTVRIHNVENASLPVVYMEVSDTRINPMYGYANRMDTQYIRDGITPLSADRMLTVVLDAMGNEVASVAYEITTADGTQTVENGTILNLKEQDGCLTAQFKVQNPILMNQEYTLCLALLLEDGNTYYYYTRLLQRVGTDIEECLEFVEMFYQSCLDAERAYDVLTYLESDSSAANDSYTSLNIHSSFSLISWGDMHVSLEKKAYPVIKEMNETTCSISIAYVISDELEDGHRDYYNVTDFYRVRSTQSRVVLLDFERETEEIFDEEHVEFTKKGICLGVTDKDVEYLANGTIAAFVQSGELWSFDRSMSKLTKVFSFRTGELDVRENLQNHDIKIVRVDDDGNIDFIVYGYMNCDEHQGEVGIGVYHYEEELNQINEEMFIPVNTSYEFLENHMGILSYVTTDNLLYLLMENDLYEVDIEKKEYSVAREDLKQGCYVVSKSQENIAWMEEMSENASTGITVMNLESGESYQIHAGEGERIRALGFINEDFVYGLAREEDIGSSDTGETIFAMYTVKIAQFGGEVVKEYQQPDVWVSGVNLELGLLELLRMTKEDGVYVSISSDHIMNNLQSSSETVKVRQTISERKAAQVCLEFDKAVASEKVLYLEANLVNVDESETIDLGQVRKEDGYYAVYAKGRLDSTWSSAADAILRADSQVGVVLNASQQYVWERGNRDSSHQNPVADVPEAIRKGTLDLDELAADLGDSYTVLNLTGCTLDEVLYRVSKGTPVIAKVNEEVNVVILGYNTYNTILYDPRTGEYGYYGMNDSTKLFQNAGNVFVGYMENLKAATKTS